MSLNSRSSFQILAWITGWIAYMVVMFAMVFDGIISLLFQPFIAIAASFLCVMIAWFLGLIFKVPILGRWWNSSWKLPAGLATISILILFASPTYEQIDSEGDHYLTLHPIIGPVCYFLLIFAVANWPLRSRSTCNA